MARRSRFSQEVRERAVRMVFEHGNEYGSEWEAISSIAEKIGCSAETLRKWVRQTEVDSGRRGGLTTGEQARIKDLEREVRELRRANEILRKASAYFAQAGSSPRRSNGSTGSTTDVCSDRSGTFPRPSSRRCTMGVKKLRPCRPDSRN